ncbi:N-acetylmuramoyl-L-alanine amidase [Phascolarctobacterium succinatutens]
MPAVLVEMCFISNEKELTLMKGQWFQKKTARLIAEGIEKYFA